MARGAPGGEVGLPGRHSAHENIALDLITQRRPTLAGRGAKHVVDILDNRSNVSVGQRLRRHAGPAGARLAIANHRAHQVTLLVSRHELGAQQVWPAEIAAAEVEAVAGATVDAVQRLTAGDQLGIAGWTLEGRIQPLATVLTRLTNRRGVRPDLDSHAGQDHREVCTGTHAADYARTTR